MEKLLIASWNITKACNLKCQHCYIDAGEASANELTLEEGKRLLDEMKELGAFAVILSGGEPLLRKDIFDVIRYGSDIGLKVYMGSNGTLITKEAARKLKEAGLDTVGISLESTVPSEHDEFRGVPGAWERSMEGMKACGEAGLTFRIHKTVSSFNYESIRATYRLALDLRAEAFCPFLLIPTGRAARFFEVDPNEVERLLEFIYDIRRESPITVKPSCMPQFCRILAQRIGDESEGFQETLKQGAWQIRCSAGINYCRILPDGSVTPCAFMPLIIENVRSEGGLVKIWKESEVFKKLRNRDNLKGKCGKCRYREICGGCRARAYAYFGDFLAEEPWCIYREE